MATAIITTDWDSAATDYDVVVPPPPPPVEKFPSDHLTIGAWFIFAAGILVFMSGYSEYRPQIGNLALHPYQFPLLFAFPLVALVRIHRFPMLPLMGILIFVAMYVFSMLPSGFDLSEAAKVISTLACMIGTALLVRSRKDFTLGAVGLTIGVGILAVIALLGVDTETGQMKEVLDTGNKNAYSLYALPAILVAGYVIVYQERTSIAIKAFLAAGILAALLTIFISANRSGYVGAVLIGVILLVKPTGRELVLWILFGIILLGLRSLGGNSLALGATAVVGGLRLLWRPRAIGIFIVLLVAAAVFWILSNYLTTQTFTQRMEATQQGIDSDRLRMSLAINGFQIAVANPLLGVSPQQIPYYLGARIQSEFHYAYLDSHNVFVHLMAATGFICFFAFLGIAFLLANWNPFPQIARELPASFLDARNLVQGLLFLYLVRGMFTREILYNPGFAIALGLGIGLMMVTADQKQVAHYDPDEYDGAESYLATT